MTGCGTDSWLSNLGFQGDGEAMGSGEKPGKKNFAGGRRVGGEEGVGITDKVWGMLSMTRSQESWKSGPRAQVDSEWGLGV